MKEDFLHYIWMYKQFDSSNLKTSKGEKISIIALGQHNLSSGPDFFNAQIRVDNQLWAGNVEIHLKSSDWFLHNHENDKAYDNVILHVVWEHDVEVFRDDNTEIPTLELKHYVDLSLINNYKTLIASKSWINCENQFSEVNNFSLNSWLERLYIERLEEKSVLINDTLSTSHANWEAVLFKMLAKNFGLNINGEAFLSLANSFDFSIVQKLQHNGTDLEALFFGQSNLLKDEIEDAYYLQLQENYKFLKQKFSIDNQGVLPLKFFRLRPPNFPTIRLAQLAQLYTTKHSLFSKIIECESKDEFYKLLDFKTSDYWDTHYTFSKVSKSQVKKLSKSFIDLLIVNTIVPLKFAYLKYQGNEDDTKILNLISQLPIEKNSIVSKFLDLKPIEKTALNSQALLQLKHNYCDYNKCLQCAIGNTLIINK